MAFVIQERSVDYPETGPWAYVEECDGNSSAKARARHYQDEAAASGEPTQYRVIEVANGRMVGEVAL